MTRILKNTTTAIVIFIFFMLLAIGALVTFVTPNQFKPLITAQVLKYTGRQLTMDGDLAWTVFPYLGIKTGHAALSNPPQFSAKNFAEIDHATVGVKLLPLLHSAVEFNEITLSGVKFNLIKNANGETNWTNLEKHSEKQLASDSAQGPVKKSAFSLQVPLLDIHDAVVDYSNLQTNQSVQLSHFELTAKDISFNNPFVFSSSCRFDSKHPDASGHIKLSGKITADLEQNIYNVKDLTLMLTTKQHKKELTLDVTADADVDLAQQVVTLTTLTSRIANLTLKGSMTVTQLSTTPLAQGHLEVPAFDLKALLQAIGQDNPNLQAAKDVSGKLDFATSADTKPLLERLKLDGKLAIPELQAAKIKANNVEATLLMQNGNLQITSLTAALYQGTASAQAGINLLAPAAPLSFQAKLANIQAEPLLSDINSQGSKIKIKGVGNIDVQGTSSGLSDNIVKNLNGKSTFSFQNGVVDGINIGYLIDSANNFLHGQSPPAKNDNLTNFGNLTGTAVITNGVVTNNDLAILSPRFDLKGQGTLNLVNQQIEYNLQIQPKVPGQTDNSGININNLIIPVSVTGSLSSPSISLDVKTLAQYVAKQRVDQVKDKLKDQIKNKLPGNAGAILGNFLGK